MLPDPFQRALVLTGPTGSGKSRLGVELAETLDAEIISLDSMALYRGMDIGTAKPQLEARMGVRHHLIDELEPWEPASVAWWLRRAAECCVDIEKRGKLVLFVGGTPLYIKALLFGLFAGPAADAKLREQLQAEAEQSGCEVLHSRLASVDPAAAARLHPHDVRRIVRALEVWELTGCPLTQWQTQWPSGKSEYAAPQETPRIIWLEVPRQQLYSRINERVLSMVEAGLVEEVRGLRQLPRALSREASQALGYKEVFAFLDGQATLEETVAKIQTRTRQFAKRQMTWFRRLPGCIPASEELTRSLWKLTI